MNKDDKEVCTKSNCSTYDKTKTNNCKLFNDVRKCGIYVKIKGDK